MSGFIVVLSTIPYGIRVYQRKIKPNLVSWSIWAFLGLALLLTYKSSGAGSNLWPAVFGFTNPLIIAILAIWRGEHKRPTRLEVACVAFGVASIVLWYFVQNDPSTVQYALYIAIIADLWAAIPTIVFLWNNPKEDRPVAWSVFAVGYGIAVFAITEHTFANYILPLYVFALAGTIACLLVVYRVKNHVPLKEWI
ncbi:MAG: hypothetical protein AAB635_01075 [Patescibacteria group bacterium]